MGIVTITAVGSDEARHRRARPIHDYIWQDSPNIAKTSEVQGHAIFADNVFINVIYEDKDILNW